ncbi:MAG: LamG-like jellyroll fold domain-containing protein [Euryarchaeota archaeon]|nr:LamG-like jellyroll fold domain-containing protein [Euryarchaeota archaeon]
MSLSRGLVGHWSLDEESYNPSNKRLTDKSAYNNHGTSANAASFVADRMGQADRAMDFDGDDDEITIPHNDSLNLDRFTLHARVRVDEITRPNTIVTKSKYGIKVAPDKSVVFSGRGTPDGTTWTEVEETTESQILTLAVFDGYLYAGTGASGKILRSSDGTTWTEVEETSETYIRCLAVFGGYLYAGTYPNGKIFRSSDGTTWTEVEDTSETYIFCLAVFDGYLYAGTVPSGKIFRSSDGTTWTEVEETSESYIFCLAVFDGYLYAGTYPSGKIFRSSDGTTWTEVEETSESYIYCLAVFDGYLYAGTAASGKIFRSSDGTTWTEVEEASESHILCLAVFDGYLYAGTGSSGKIFRSSDGTTWTEVEETSESQIRSLAVFDGYLYAGTYPSGKIFRMGDGYDTYSNTKITESVWTDIIATFDGSSSKIYINNVLDKTDVNIITIGTNALDLLIGNSYGSTIGGYSSTGEENLKGSIDNLRIYNRALTEAEITLLYESYRPKTVIV